MKKKEPIYVVIKDYLLEIIDKNKNIPNFKSPSENQLAMKFQVSRISAGRAIKEIEQEGLVYRRQGQGSFIAEKASKLSTIDDNKQDDIVCLIMASLQGQFVGKIMEGIQYSLNKQNIHLIIMTTNSQQDNEERMIKTAIKNGCKGLIVFPVDNNVYNKEMLKLTLNNFPLVLIDRSLPGLDLSLVACDHFRAAYNGTKFLIERGHQRVGFISQDPNSASSVEERLHGYEKAMIDNALLYSGTLKCIIDLKDDSFESNIEKYMDEANPTAIITNSFGYGARIIEIVKKRKKKISEGIELMFFDNEFNEFLKFLDFNPIIIDQNPFEIGKTAAELLYKMMYINPKPQKILIEENIYMS